MLLKDELQLESGGRPSGAAGIMVSVARLGARRLDSLSGHSAILTVLLYQARLLSGTAALDASVSALST